MAGLALDYYAMVGRLDSRVSRISAIGESQLALSAELTNYFFCVLAEAPTHEFRPFSFRCRILLRTCYQACLREMLC